MKDEVDLRDRHNLSSHLNGHSVLSNKLILRSRPVKIDGHVELPLPSVGEGRRVGIRISYIRVLV
jgi:hypothetical protein